MTQGLALELADKRIRVNCVVPGIVSTELWDKMGTIGKGDEQAQKLEAMGKKLPVGFCATGEHIAEAYLYAVRADYATGSLITIGELEPHISSRSRRSLTDCRWRRRPEVTMY